MTTASVLTILIPANNEQAYIGRCLDALLEQDAAAGTLRVVVAANACRDATVATARSREAAFAARGSKLIVLDIAEPGKPNALDCAEAEAAEGARVFLDADVICDPELIGQIRIALATAAPRYATGTLCVMPARSSFTRAYARLWQNLPFFQSGAVGAGFFAVNPAGRARWGRFPRIISDDTFVRVNFTPEERVEVPARYHWPMIEGFRGLVKVRRRQDAGVMQMQALYPQLMANEAKPPLHKTRLLGLALRQPLDLAAYLAVHLAVRLYPKTTDWTRGR